MKNITLLSSILLLVMAFTTENELPQGIDTEHQQDYAAFFKKNMAITDVSLTSISKSHYVKELYIKNFSDLKWDYDVFSTENGVYLDNGLYNDKQARDGIYTSMDAFEYDDNIKYNKDQLKESIINTPIFDSNFEYVEDLNSYSKKAESTSPSGMNHPSIAAKPEAEVALNCDIEFGTCQCRAHTWGWCNCCCAKITNCTFTIKVGI